MNLDDIKAKCLECGECWEWRGIVSKSNVPKINIHVGRGKSGRTVLSARRVVWEMVHRAIPKGMLVTTKCGNPKCLNPAHLKLTNRAQVAKIVGARLDVKMKKAASSASMRRAKITRTQAEEIRLSDKSAKELALEYGVGPSAINKIRKHETWRALGNPFAGLL